MLRRFLTIGMMAGLAVSAGCKAGGNGGGAEMAGMKKPAPPAELQKLASWVGEWEGEGTMYAGGDKSAPPMKSKGTDKVEWVLDGMFLKWTFESDMGEMGKMNGAWIAWYDPQAKLYRSNYFDNWGHTGEGTMRYNEKKSAWDMKWEGDGLEGMKTHGEGTMSMPDNNTIQMTMTEWSGWNKVMEGTGTSKRKK